MSTVGLWAWLLLAAGGPEATPLELPRYLSSRVEEIPGGRLTGTVRGPDGRPVRDAQVHWVLLGSNATVPAFAAGTTDDHGRFELPRSFKVGDEALRWSALFAHQPGLAPAIEVFGRVPETLDLRLQHGLTLEARLHHPVLSTEGVQLRLRDVDGAHVPAPCQGSLNATADPFGRCRLTNLPPGKLSLVVSHDYFVHPRAAETLLLRPDGVVCVKSGVYSLPFRPRESPVEIEVGVGGKLTGRVVFVGTKAPAPGVQVWAEPAGGARHLDYAVTDDDGRYTIGPMPVPRADIGTTLPDELAAEYAAASVLRDQWVAPFETRQVYDLELTRGWLVRGRVLPAPDRELPEQMWLCIQGRTGTQHPEYRDIAPDGRFTVRLLSGWTLLTVRAEGRRPGPAMSPLDVEVPGHDRLEVVLPAGMQETVTGTVLSPEGEPVDGASVVFRSVDDDERIYSQSTRYGGRFEIAGYDHRRRLAIWACHGFDATPEPVVRLPDSDEPPVVRLTANVAGVARGLLFWPDGRPVRTWLRVQGMWQGRWRDCSSGETTGDGAFEVSCPPPAIAYRLRWQPIMPDGQSPEGYSTPFTVAPAQVVALPVVVVRVEDLSPTRP